MTSGKIELSKKENDRVRVLVRAAESGRTNKEVALALSLCVRQVQRLAKALAEEGPAGLAHGNRGSIPKHALMPQTVASVVDLYETKHQGFNFTHFTEKLVEVEGIQINRSSVRRVLIASGHRSPKKRRAPKHRSRRERRACEGAMVQIDGSLHVYYQGVCIAGTPPADIPPKAIKVLDSRGRQTEECPWANLRPPKPKQEKPIQPTERRPYKPPPNHPWRRWDVT